MRKREEGESEGQERRKGERRYYVRGKGNMKRTEGRTKWMKNKE